LALRNTSFADKSVGGACTNARGLVGTGVFVSSGPRKCPRVDIALGSADAFCKR
jgi:hypothetical protein